jgi:hypothetical protein
MSEFTPEQINEALTTVDDWHAGGHCTGGHTPACALAAGLRQERLTTTRKTNVLAAVTALLDQLKRDGLLVANEDVVRNLTMALAFDAYEESHPARSRRAVRARAQRGVGMSDGMRRRAGAALPRVGAVVAQPHPRAARRCVPADGRAGPVLAGARGDDMSERQNHRADLQGSSPTTGVSTTRSTVTRPGGGSRDTSGWSPTSCRLCRTCTATTLPVAVARSYAHRPSITDGVRDFLLMGDSEPELWAYSPTTTSSYTGAG